MKYILMLLALLNFVSCTKGEDNTDEDISDYKTFTSVNELTNLLDSLSGLADNHRLTALWDSLVIHKQIPFILGDSVAFLYMGDTNTNSVKWAGDFNGWNPEQQDYSGKRVGLSNIWMVEKSFPLDARLDYKIVVDGQWRLDPVNNLVQYSGFGPNSELRMPEWEFPQETILINGVSRGTLSGNISILSSTDNLGYKVNYRIYTPAGYKNLSDLPVIYVTDGQEYSDDRLGAMLIVLDNIIYQQKIEPCIAVFIDPRDPDNLSNNRRMTEYAANIRFANFVADELVPQIDLNYKTNASPDKRAILGTSMGGWNSAFFGLKRSDKFHLIGIHSPAFDQIIIQEYSLVEKLPLKMFMSTGVIYDTQDRARAMKVILDQKGYPLIYVEVNQGHSWGNWRALIEEPLVYFFGK